MSEQLKKKTYIFYMVLIGLSCLSYIFSNFGYDSEYQLAMAYRLIKGDQLIVEMWEPHQTSAFLCVVFMKLYMLITGTTTGIVLYTQVVGIAIRGIVTVLMYKLVKNISGNIPAFAVGVIYLLVSPKELLTPEFGNMQLWFTTLMFLALMRYFQKPKVVYIVLAAVSFCLSVFSYPSAIIIYIAAIAILIKYSKKSKRDIAVFTGVCILIGGSFVGYLLLAADLEVMLKSLECALALEPSHTVNGLEKTLWHILYIAKTCGMLAVVVFIGFIFENILRIITFFKSRKKEKISVLRWMVISWYVLMFFFLLNILSVSKRGGYVFPFIVVLILGFAKRGFLTEKEKMLYYASLWISGLSVLATLILSDNSFLQAVAYMLILICMSVLPIWRWYKSLDKEVIGRKCMRVGIHLWFVLFVFRALYIHIPINGAEQICSVTQDMSIIRSGPAIGIITDPYGVTKQRDSMGEWQQYIKPGDTIWILASPVDTLGYLYEDVNVGAPTVMSTPTYNENLLYYWEVNPEKYPDVVILSSCYGELTRDVAENEWLMQWLEEEYCAERVVDGHYWRYYFKE